MKYGIREICDVVLRAKSKQEIGDITFYKDMPVLYFDSLKTSSLEGAATTVYATGGRGNTRLIAWEGEKTITFTMEDALISPISLSVLSGAGILKKTENTDMSKIQHATETTEVQTATVDGVTKNVCGLKKVPLDRYDAPATEGGEKTLNPKYSEFYMYIIPLDSHGDMAGQPYRIENIDIVEGNPLGGDYLCTLNLDSIAKNAKDSAPDNPYTNLLKNADLLMVDYYYKSDTATVTEIDIDAQNFAGNYYLEASTLWRNKSGKDIAAEFIIPNCKIQSNFTFSLAATGDPSTFTFTMDAFPDYTKYNKGKKVLCAIRLVEEDTTSNEDNGDGYKIEKVEKAVTDNGGTEPETQPASGTYNWRSKLNTEN